jgi:hypothetical protein
MGRSEKVEYRLYVSDGAILSFGGDWPGTAWRWPEITTGEIASPFFLVSSRNDKYLSLLRINTRRVILVSSSDERIGYDIRQFSYKKLCFVIKPVFG